MSRMLDLDKKKKELLQTIDELYQIVKDCDDIINEQQDKKDRATEKIEKFNQFILTAEEMYSYNPKSLKENIETPEQKVIPSNGSVEGLTLPKAIRKIMNSYPEKSFTVKEMTNLLVQKGYNSPAEKKQNLVFNSLHRLTGKYWSVRKKGHKNYYRLIKKDGIDSLLK